MGRHGECRQQRRIQGHPLTVSPRHITKSARCDDSVLILAWFLSDSDWGTRFPPVLNVDQAAELAAVPKKTIYEWSSRGLLDGCASRFGRRLRICRDRFIRLLFEN